MRLIKTNGIYPDDTIEPSCIHEFPPEDFDITHLVAQSKIYTTIRPKEHVVIHAEDVQCLYGHDCIIQGIPYFSFKDVYNIQDVSVVRVHKMSSRSLNNPRMVSFTLTLRCVKGWYLGYYQGEDDEG